MERAELPAGPGSLAAIPSIPGLGTTWYRRGPAYWSRRAGIAMLLLAIVALYGGIIAAVALGLRGGAGIVVFLAITAVWVALSAAWYLRRARLSRVDRSGADRKGLRELRWYTTAVTTAKALGVLLILGASVAALLGHRGVVRAVEDVVGLVVALVFIGTVWLTGGALLVAFAQSLAPRLRTEREARARMAAAGAGTRR